MDMTASDYKGAIVAFVGTPTLNGPIHMFWEWEAGHSHDLKLQSLYVTVRSIRWALLNLDTDPVYKADDDAGLTRRQQRREELQLMLYETRSDITGYTPGGGGAVPAAGELTTTKLIDASDNWTDPSSPYYSGSPFHDTLGRVGRY